MGCYFPGVALRCVVLLLNLADYFGCGLVASGVCRFGGLGLVRVVCVCWRVVCLFWCYSARLV